MKKEKNKEEEEIEEKNEEQNEDNGIVYITIGVLKIPFRTKDLNVIKWLVVVFGIVGGTMLLFKEGGAEKLTDSFVALIQGENGEEGEENEESEEFEEIEETEESGETQNNPGNDVNYSEENSEGGQNFAGFFNNFFGDDSDMANMGSGNDELMPIDPNAFFMEAGMAAGNVATANAQANSNGNATATASAGSMGQATEQAGFFNLSGILAGSQPLVVNSVTYEALVKYRFINEVNTIMGREGVLMLRLGDEAAGVNRCALQICGEGYHMESTDAANLLTTNTWYHVAFTYNHKSGLGRLYLNGVEVACGDFGKGCSFDIGGNGQGENGGQGLFIGKVAGFRWGERPHNGCMKEVRVWSTARTPQQIRENMFNVNPQSKHLEVYYKLNGTDFLPDGVRDAAGKRDGSVYGVITSEPV